MFEVAIHYYGRLAAKQGWRFDSTYDHKDETGEPVPFIFTLGSGKVIAGIESAVKSMKVGGIRRVIIPPSQGYQNMDQEPIPPNNVSLVPDMLHLSSELLVYMSFETPKFWISAYLFFFVDSILTGKGCSPPFLIQHALQMEKALLWESSYLILNL
ncbi:peptidyl-prolyl cis-trans isomerase FKBP17-1, chloroplastic isoform X2 [Tanacetum coccineum]